MVLLGVDSEGKGQVKHQSPVGQPSTSHDPERESQAHDRMLAVLDAIAKTSTLVMEDIADHVANTIRQGLGLEHLRLLLVNEQRNVLEPIERDAEASLPNEKSPELCLGEGLVGWAAEHGTVLRVGDVYQDPRHITADSPWPPGIRSTLIVPLMAEEQVVGVIDAASLHPDAFSDADEHLMTAIARQLAVAIENARRYQETKKTISTPIAALGGWWTRSYRHL